MTIRLDNDFRQLRPTIEERSPGRVGLPNLPVSLPFHDEQNFYYQIQTSLLANDE